MEGHCSPSEAGRMPLTVRPRSTLELDTARNYPSLYPASHLEGRESSMRLPQNAKYRMKHKRLYLRMQLLETSPSAKKSKSLSRPCRFWDHTC